MIELEGKTWKSKKERYWIAYIEDIDLSTQGRDKKEAIEMIKDAIISLVNKKKFKIRMDEGKKGKFVVTSKRTNIWLGFILQRLRMKQGLTIEEVANKMGFSSKNAYARYEQGKSIPGLDKLSQILGAIGSDKKSVIKIAA